MARIFWDTNLFIYLFEDHPVLADSVAQLRRRMNERSDQLFTSALTVGEILVKPLSQGRTDVARRYVGLFQTPEITVLAFDLVAAQHYAEVRRDRGVARPDAVQLACAASAHIDLFITNDGRLSRKVVSGINFISSLQDAPI